MEIVKKDWIERRRMNRILQTGEKKRNGETVTEGDGQTDIKIKEIRVK